MQKPVPIWPEHWKSLAPYAPGVRVNNLVFVSGQVPVDPETGTSIDADIAAQTDRVLENIERVLGVVGADRANVVKTTVFLTAIQDFDRMNETYEEFFGEHRPARSTVAVSALGRPEFRIEVEAVASL